MWDYDVSASDMEKLLDGKIDKAGHYTREKLFGKILSGLPWYTIIQLIPVENIKEMLTDEVIGKLWPKSVQKQYEYVRKRLQEALPTEKILANKFSLLINQSIVYDDYIRYYIEDEGMTLKIEFVNDIAYRCGVPNLYQYGLIDTPLNILTNKLTAIVGRDEPKDVFDICVLAQHYSFNWPEVFGEAKNKAIINEIDVEQRIKSFPVHLFQKVDWHILPWDINLLTKAIQTIANDILLGSDNSLGGNKPAIEDATIINPHSN